jgi:hypothetical protein
VKQLISEYVAAQNEYVALAGRESTRRRRQVRGGPGFASVGASRPVADIRFDWCSVSLHRPQGRSLPFLLVAHTRIDLDYGCPRPLHSYLSFVSRAHSRTRDTFAFGHCATGCIIVPVSVGVRFQPEARGWSVSRRLYRGHGGRCPGARRPWQHVHVRLAPS